jgi:hypothetical protein
MIRNRRGRFVIMAGLPRQRIRFQREGGHHGSCRSGHRGNARHRRRDQQGAEGAGYKVAASYAGNDEAAQKFKAETGIAVYKWDVSSFDACVGGHQAGRGRTRPGRSAGQQRRHHPRRMFHRMSAEQWTAVIAPISARCST